MDTNPDDRPAPAAPAAPLLLRGFAPLVVAAVLAVLMVLLVPSIAPERVVIQPGSGGASGPTTTVVAP